MYTGQGTSNPAPPWEDHGVTRGGPAGPQGRWAKPGVVVDGAAPTLHGAQDLEVPPPVPAKRFGARGPQPVNRSGNALDRKGWSRVEPRPAISVTTSNGAIEQYLSASGSDPHFPAGTAAEWAGARHGGGPVAAPLLSDFGGESEPDLTAERHEGSRGGAGAGAPSYMEMRLTRNNPPETPLTVPGAAGHDSSVDMNESVASEPLYDYANHPSTTAKKERPAVQRFQAERYSLMMRRNGRDTPQELFETPPPRGGRRSRRVPPQYDLPPDASDPESPDYSIARALRGAASPDYDLVREGNSSRHEHGLGSEL